MIYEKQRVMGWINASDIWKLQNPDAMTNRTFIYKEKNCWQSTPDKIPCYYNPPEHPSDVMNNLFECAVVINSLFDERNK